MTPHSRTKKRRILLMYITRVSGHRQATMAIQRAVKQLDPNAEAPTVNGFGYTYPRLEKVVNSAYMGVIKTTPKVWDYMYDNPKIVKKSKPIKDFLHKTSHDKIDRLVKKYRPDTIVCTQAFPCGMVAAYKRDCGATFKLVGVLTDYAPHSFWLNEGVDYYVVPSSEAKERFMTKGISEDSIKVYGIPIRSKFSVQLDKKPIAKKLGIDPSVPTVLIMGGGQGLGPIRDVVRSLLKIDSPLQMIVLTGVNKKLMKWLGKQRSKKRKKSHANKTLLFYEYANNVDELMEIATLIVTKPGGMTTSECLSKGLPMVIVNPLPGQEMRNTDFLLKKGIAIRIDKTSDIGEEIELVLKSPDKIADMRKAAYAEAHPHGALDIAKLILDEKVDI
ncbi:MAG: MGDG synthase family glycosyltransferase [Candidatus Omnitrophota bacterium]